MNFIDDLVVTDRTVLFQDHNQSGPSCHWLGLCEFTDVDKLQKNILLELYTRHQEIILGMEFFPTISLGKRAHVVDEISEINLLHENNFEIVNTDRGGLATLHSPGQLVIYPMINLHQRKLGVRDFLYMSLEGLRRQLELHYGVKTQIHHENLGLFTSNGKLVFCGIRVEKGIVRHGFSINIRNNLKLFNLIRSCGTSHMRIDSLYNYDCMDSCEEVFSNLKSAFCFT